MNSQELRALQEAYSQVYQLDEISYETAKSAYDKRKDREIGTNSTKKSEQTFSRVRKRFGQKVAKQMRRENPWNNMNKTLESYDLYDIILSHLLDEGYADTEQAAEVIMVNMSEEWRDCIIEREMDEPGERDENPSVKSHNRRVGYRPKPKRRNIEDDPRYGTVRDKSGKWKY